jgi:hypothetical protein
LGKKPFHGFGIFLENVFTCFCHVYRKVYFFKRIEQGCSWAKKEEEKRCYKQNMRKKNAKQETIYLLHCNGFGQTI